MNFEAGKIAQSVDEGVKGCRCRLCDGPVRQTVVDLGMSPLCESYLSADELDGEERYYPLHAMVCGECFLVQLKQYVSAEHIFSDYAYFSSYSTSWVEHARVYVGMIAQRLNLGSNSLAIELASNDGYLLQHFGPLGIPALGIEPAANVAKAAIQKGVATRVDFFGRRLAGELSESGLQADLIIGNNVLAQVPDLNDFVDGMRQLLKPEGVVTLEFPHVQRLIEGNQFDTIYHEHFSYFSLITIELMAARHELKVIDVEELPTHGGSLRVYLAHAGSSHPHSDRVDALIEEEEAFGLRKLETYAAFGEQVKWTKRRLLEVLIAAKDAGQSICGYGAPGKGNTLLNYCGVGRDFLDFTVDRNPHKHGRFTPGMHVPILPVEALEAAKPDYVLILPWNLRDEVVRQMRHIAGWGGKFLVPIPEASIIDPKELDR